MNTASTPDRPGLGSWLPGYLLLALIWGSSFLFIKVGVRELHPLYVTLGRVVAGALTVVALVLVTRTRLPRDPRVWGHLVVVGAVGVVIPFTLFGYGEQRVSSVLAGIWNATTPLVALPVATLAFRTERLTARRIAGFGIGFAGVLVVLGVWHGIGGVQLTGQLMCLGAAACYGFAIPYQRRFLSGLAGSGLAVPAGQLITATAMLLVVAPLVAGAPPAPTALSGDVVASVLALGALGTGLAFVLNFRVIRFAGATTSTSVTYLMPIVSTLIGVLALDEHIHWYQPTGALLVLAGVAVSQGMVRLPGSRSRERRAAREPATAAVR
ncbi:DMT family transporter [Planosporangium sp. 12N6]|uniref:DMT family transporter n=1 Tax=Planosporangium spinosum TaxID=3402278 RepID=UPI003CECC985